MPGVEPHQVFLLIDENLSPQLVKTAVARGFRAVHVNHVGLTTKHDKSVARYAVDHDMIVVTRNRADFERMYARRALHPGLVFLIADRDMTFSVAEQADMLSASLDEIIANEPIQQAILVELLGEAADGLALRMTRIDLPAEA